MGWKAAKSKMIDDLRSLSFIRFSERPLMKLLVKGDGSPFNDDVKNPTAELNLNKDENKLSLT